MVQEQLDAHMQKKEIGYHLTLCAKWVGDINVRVKAIKVLQENIGIDLQDL